MQKTRRARCSPLYRNRPTCYDPKAIQSLVSAWNLLHPNDPAPATKPLAFLQKRMTQCRNQDERCLSAKLLSSEESNKLLKKNFAPKHPKKWLRNKNEWLTSDEIIDMLKQYEVAYPAFKFIGPSPSDFFFMEPGELECAWPELCSFDLESYLKKGKTKFGISFNTDLHHEPGSHWVSMFINATTPVIGVYYFDSAGDTIHENIAVFRDKVIEQARKLGRVVNFEENGPVAHQKGGTECGMYSLFFITTMLEYDKQYEADNAEQRVFAQLNQLVKPKTKGGGHSFFARTFKNRENTFSDKHMESLRHVFFNEP